jgi:glutaminyl-peptide cyclotransferase
VLRSVLILTVVLLQAPAAAPRFDSNRAWEHLRQIVGIGPRPSGSPAISKTRQYIKSELARLDLTATEQSWDATTPAGRVPMVNLSVTIPGSSRDRLIIGGHYDTKRFREFRFVGANDGGSSAAFLLELARVLKGRKGPLTIELLFLDGEEAVDQWQGSDRTYGSRHYVETAGKNGTLASIKAFVLVDMIAEREPRFLRESFSTPWLTDIIWGAARSRGLAEYFPDEPVAIEDDHEEFLKAGVPAVDIIDLDYPAWHTPLDTLDPLSARSLQIVGDVLLAALPQIEQRLTRR